MRFQAEEGTTCITVGGQQYDVGEDGSFECQNHEHYGQLKQLGCRREDEIIEVERVVANEPPEIPAGYVDPDTVRALIEECEDQKVAIGKLNGDVDTLRGELSSAQLVETELRERIAELTGQLEAATNALSSATEAASGNAGGDAGGQSTTGTGAATEDAPPATGKAKAK